MLRLWMLLFSIFWALSLKAEPYVGFSSFAALSSKFPCSNFLAIANRARRPAMTVLHGTFGANYQCVNRFIQANRHRPHLVQVHLMNGPCRRNARCHEGEVLPKVSPGNFNRRLERKNNALLASIIDRAYVVMLSLKPEKTTKVVLSIELEDNFTPRAFRNVFYAINQIWWNDPFAQIVRGPVGPRCSPSFSFCESHGVLPDGSAAIWNQDGDDLPLSDDARWLSSCKQPGRLACFLWSARAQGIFGDSFVRPRDRNFEITNFDILTYGELISR